MPTTRWQFHRVANSAKTRSTFTRQTHVHRLVTAIGTIREAKQEGDLTATITCPPRPRRHRHRRLDRLLGRVPDRGGQGGVEGDGRFTVNISGETLARSVPAHWVEGARLNLETALKLGDELGGHIVTGHVDGVGSVASITPVGDLPRRDRRASRSGALYRRQGPRSRSMACRLTVNEVVDQRICHLPPPRTSSRTPSAGTTIGALSPGIRRSMFWPVSQADAGLEGRGRADLWGHSRSMTCQRGC
jgi:riboflavin synthase